MRTVKLADGTAFAADWCGLAGGALSVSLPETTLGEAYAAFSAPGAADMITFDAGSELVDVYEGFTQIFAIGPGWNGGTIITLKKGADS